MNQPIVPDENRCLFNTLLLILNEIDHVCNKIDVQYYLAFGTLIGAVRHKGFIPWDDDIDLIMKRHDYEKFITQCQQHFHPGFSIQTTYNQEGYYRYVARVRKDDTTYIGVNDKKLLNAGIRPKYNLGIYISIFPIDTVPNNRILYQKQQFMSVVRHRLLTSALYNTENTTKAKIARLYCNLVGIKSIFKRLDKSFARYSSKPGKYLQIPEQIESPNNTWPACDFDDVCYMEFEGKKYPAPIGYDEILRICYGDYMKLPPVQERIPRHDAIVCTNQGYKEFVNKNYPNAK